MLRTVESSKALHFGSKAPIHFGQDFPTAAVTPAQMPAEDCTTLIEEMTNAKKDT